jgi:uncharacterized protein
MAATGIALVTGASGGIGEHLARHARSAGYHVVLVARSAPKLEQLAAELGDARVVAADLGTPDGVAAVIAAVPHVDVLVNNAGYGDFGPFLEADADRALGMIRLNVEALTALTRAYLPGMVANRNGHVLNVASTASFFPGPLMAVYYATKHYVLAFSEGIAEELRETGVTITALCPGPTESGFQAGAAMESSKLVKGKRLPSSAEVAAFGWKAMERGDVVAVHGMQNKLNAFSTRFTPRPVMRRMVARVQRSDH